MPRTPTWRERERENNKCRERRRRAIAAKIFAGLRLYGRYTLPKHCDNNEVLKALCNEAGWTVEPDGTTYRKESRPMENMDIIGASTSAPTTVYSSYQQSPHTSYSPSPPDANPLIPWLVNPSSSKIIHHHLHGGSISAPVSPPSSSTPRYNPDSDGSFARLNWGPFFPMSMPPSPGCPTWGAGTQSGSTSPALSLVTLNPFGFRVEDLSQGGSLVFTPGQNGTCSPAEVAMRQVIPNEFAFRSKNASLVKPWEGETIHEECGPDDLELTLGSSKPR